MPLLHCLLTPQKPQTQKDMLMAHKQCQCLQSSRSGARYSTLSHCSSPMPRAYDSLGRRGDVSQGGLGVRDTARYRTPPEPLSPPPCELTRVRPCTLPTVHRGHTHIIYSRPLLWPLLDLPLSLAPPRQHPSPCHALFPSPWPPWSPSASARLRRTRASPPLL